MIYIALTLLGVIILTGGLLFLSLILLTDKKTLNIHSKILLCSILAIACLYAFFAISREWQEQEERQELCGYDGFGIYHDERPDIPECQ